MAKDKEDFIKRHIVKKYLPYKEKVAMCTSIVDVTMSMSGVFKQDTPTRHLLFVMSVIDKYTDIEIDFNNSLDDFDILCESGVGNNIMSLIDESERDMITTVLNMCVDDYMENNRSLASMLDSFKLSIGSINDVLSEIIENPEIKNKMLEFTKI